MATCEVYGRLRSVGGFVSSIPSIDVGGGGVVCGGGRGGC